MTVHVWGTPHQMGKAHGAACRSLILGNIRTVKAVVEAKGVSWRTYDDWLAKNSDYLQAHCQQQVQEMQGIAEGAGVAYHDILLINIQLYFMADQLPNECTTLIARGSATLDGKTYIAKIRDMNGPFSHVVLHRHYPEGLECIEVHVAGTVTYAGLAFNNQGLSATSTGMWSRKYPVDTDLICHSELQINPAAIVRECQDIRGAARYLDTHSRMIRLNLFVVDQQGAAVFEMIDDDYELLYDQDGLLMRSNHFLSERLKDYNPTPQQYPSTYCRYARGMEYLKAHHGGIRFQDMLQICSDHENGANSICRHDAQVGPTTSFVSINVLEDRQVWTMMGHACEAIQMDSLPG